VGIVYFANPTLKNSETVFIDLSGLLFNPWMQGILLSALVSAIMSTVSALILMSGSALVEDFYRAFIRKNASAKEYLLVSRLAVLLVAIVAIAIAANPNLTIFGSVGFAWSGLGASFGPVILFSLYWARTTAAGAIAGIAVGAITVIGWDLLAKCVGGPLFGCPDILPGFSLLPGYILSALAIYVVSLNTKPPEAAVNSDFNKMLAQI
jgi:sodium/proline symporter